MNILQINDTSPEVQAIHRQWYKDLKSGDFSQCQAQLVSTSEDEGVNTVGEAQPGRDSFCCVEVLFYRTWPDLQIEDQVTGESDYYGNNDYCNHPIPGGISMKRLSNMNDEQGKSFSEIADILAESWDQYGIDIRDACGGS